MSKKLDRSKPLKWVKFAGVRIAKEHLRTEDQVSLRLTEAQRIELRDREVSRILHCRGVL